MRLVPLSVLLLVVTAACSMTLPTSPDAARETASWPPPEQALASSSAAMNELKTLRERVSSRTYRNGEPFLEVDAERAYAAPDRRYERMDGRSSVESVGGETVWIGQQFFKRVGENAAWQRMAWTEAFAWPAGEYSFTAMHGVAWAGSGEVDGRPARILLVPHRGSAEKRNAGWEFQTRLWLDPSSGYFLRRETAGTHEDSATGQSQRYEATWTYLDHNGAIRVVEPPGAVGAR